MQKNKDRIEDTVQDRNKFRQPSLCGYSTNQSWRSLYTEAEEDPQRENEEFALLNNACLRAGILDVMALVAGVMSSRDISPSNIPNDNDDCRKGLKALYKNGDKNQIEEGHVVEHVDKDLETEDEDDDNILLAELRSKLPHKRKTKRKCENENLKSKETIGATNFEAEENTTDSDDDENSSDCE
ncbi:hypothetical protein ILUMI_25488 [Ignelater luminosus]|uniref:Uncharacterized protein n=1 Tax=Ignelater luminosus TaxID=2038154 RepID=A0A8K0C8C8_IGNLU|nr:hypothetical protein ILUMI_25488 [Ignelater luminosus]